MRQAALLPGALVMSCLLLHTVGVDGFQTILAIQNGRGAKFTRTGSHSPSPTSRRLSQSNATTTATTATPTQQQQQKQQSASRPAMAKKCSPQDLAVLNTLLTELPDFSPPWTTPDASARTFNYILGAAASSKLTHLGPRAERVLRYMIHELPTNPHLQPNTVTLNYVLAMYNKSKNSSSGRKNGAATTTKPHPRTARAASAAARALCRDWNDHWHPTGLVQTGTDRVTANTLISLCAKAQQTDLADQVFSTMIRHPDIISYNCLLNAHAVAGHTEKVGELFRTMRTEGPSPTIHTYNDVLYAYAQASPSKQPEQAEHFLHWWQQEEQRQSEIESHCSIHETQDATPAFVGPDTQSYNIVLHAMAKLPPAAADRAESLFQSIPARDAVSYTTLVATLCQLLPPSPALAAVERILDQAWREYPMDAALLSNVLYSLATVEDKQAMPAMAERVVQTARDNKIMLDMTVYDGLMHCWAKSNNWDAPQRVLELLTQLEEDPTLHPDAKTYTNAMDALKNARGSDYVKAAEDMVRRMETIGPAPNVRTYTALIMNYARSRLPTKATLAADVLTRMMTTTKTTNNDNKSIRPNVVTYNAVLNACEHTDDSKNNSSSNSKNSRNQQQDALKVACVTFDALRSDPSVTANHVTYGVFLGALGNLMPSGPAKYEIVELVFKRCCLDGQVSRLVLKKLRSAAESEEGYRDLLQGNSPNRLPESWTSRVRERRARDML